MDNKFIFKDLKEINQPEESRNLHVLIEKYLEFCRICRICKIVIVFQIGKSISVKAIKIQDRRSFLFKPVEVNKIGEGDEVGIDME